MPDAARVLPPPSPHNPCPPPRPPPPEGQPQLRLSDEETEVERLQALPQMPRLHRLGRHVHSGRHTPELRRLAPTACPQPCSQTTAVSSTGSCAENLPFPTPRVSICPCGQEEELWVPFTFWDGGLCPTSIPTEAGAKPGLRLPSPPLHICPWRE